MPVRLRFLFWHLGIRHLTVNRHNFIDRLSQLEKFNIPAESITLEVTETSVISNFDLAVENLESLSDRGVKIALDDFGVGFTSINYLREMPLSYVKLDGLYIRNLIGLFFTHREKE